MTTKESAEYGFMAVLDEVGLAVSDSNGGGHRVYATTRTEVVAAVAKYIRSQADYLADCIADDLFDEDEGSEGDEV